MTRRSSGGRLILHGSKYTCFLSKLNNLSQSEKREIGFFSWVQERKTRAGTEICCGYSLGQRDGEIGELITARLGRANVSEYKYIAGQMRKWRPRIGFLSSRVLWVVFSQLKTTQNRSHRHRRPQVLDTDPEGPNFQLLSLLSPKVYSQYEWTPLRRRVVYLSLMPFPTIGNNRGIVNILQYGRDILKIKCECLLRDRPRGKRMERQARVQVKSLDSYGPQFGSDGV